MSFSNHIGHLSRGQSPLSLSASLLSWGSEGCAVPLQRNALSVCAVGNPDVKIPPEVSSERLLDCLPLLSKMFLLLSEVRRQFEWFLLLVVISREVKINTETKRPENERRLCVCVEAISERDLAPRGSQWLSTTLDLALRTH